MLSWPKFLRNEIVISLRRVKFIHFLNLVWGSYFDIFTKVQIETIFPAYGIEWILSSLKSTILKHKDIPTSTWLINKAKLIYRIAFGSVMIMAGLTPYLLYTCSVSSPYQVRIKSVSSPYQVRIRVVSRLYKYDSCALLVRLWYISEIP